eukprot:6200573-Pleurochrysis_carterae.AAC.1
MVSAAAATERPATSTSAAVKRPEPPSSASSARTTSAANMASNPLGGSSPNSAASVDHMLLLRGHLAAAPVPPPPCRGAGSAPPSCTRAPASLRASASAFVSAKSRQIIVERGESSASASAVCCVPRQGERRSGECAIPVWGRRGRDAALLSPVPDAAAALRACITNAPRAPAPAGTPKAARKDRASRAADATPTAPSASSASRSARRHASPVAAAF